MRTRLIPLIVCLAAPAGAETLYYRYDAHGRVVQSFSDKTGYRSDYTLDQAGNRTRVWVFNTTATLSAGQSIHSPDGRFTLIMQSDGNLVLYGPDGALWHTVTYGSGSDNHASLQTDGNFVVYTADGTPVWNSNTANHPGSFLALQNDGNLVIYGASGAAIWNSNTAGH